MLVSLGIGTNHMQDSEHIIYVRLKIKRDKIITECQAALKCSFYSQRETASDFHKKFMKITTDLRSIQNLFCNYDDSETFSNNWGETAFVPANSKHYYHFANQYNSDIRLQYPNEILSILQELERFYISASFIRDYVGCALDNSSRALFFKKNTTFNYYINIDKQHLEETIEYLNNIKTNITKT